MQFKLRDYQEIAVESCLDILNSKKKSCKELVVLCTGDGKSLIQAEVAKRLDYPLVILCPSKELVEQNSKKLDAFGVEHTICSASVGKRDISKLTLATIGSIKNNWNDFIKLGVKGLLIDEAHLGVKSGSSIRKFIKKAKINKVVGLTATPCVLESSLNGASIKMLNRVRWKLFTDIRYVHQIKDTVKNGYWTPLLYRNIALDESMLKDNSSGSDYTIESQKRFYKSNDINGKIIEEYNILKKEGRKSTIIFVPTIEEAENIYSRIPNSAIVHSKMKKKERVFMIDSFKNMEIPVIINCGILQIGFDHPKLDSIINGKPTKSVNLYYQICGRAVRLEKSKKDSIIVDMAGNFNRFGKIEEFTFENIPYYGWGMFGKDNILLTDHPISSNNRPTKDSLINAGKKEAKDKNQKENPTFTFGMFKGRKLWDIAKSEDAERLKSYCSWVIDEYENGKWKFYGEDGLNLKKGICEYLKIGEVKPKTKYRKMPF